MKIVTRSKTMGSFLIVFFLLSGIQQQTKGMEEEPKQEHVTIVLQNGEKKITSNMLGRLLENSEVIKHMLENMIGEEALENIEENITISFENITKLQWKDVELALQGKLKNLDIKRFIDLLINLDFLEIEYINLINNFVKKIIKENDFLYNTELQRLPYNLKVLVIERLLPPFYYVLKHKKVINKKFVSGESVVKWLKDQNIVIYLFGKTVYSKSLFNPVDDKKIKTSIYEKSPSDFEVLHVTHSEGSVKIYYKNDEKIGLNKFCEKQNLQWLRDKICNRNINYQVLNAFYLANYETIIYMTCHYKINDLNNAVTQLLKGHKAPITSIKWAPDGRYLVSVSALDGTVCIWEKKSYIRRNDINFDQTCVILKSIKGENLNQEFKVNDENTINEQQIYNTLSPEIKELVCNLQI